MDLLIIVVEFGFIAISRSILIASGKAPQPKPMTRRGKVILYSTFFVISLVLVFLFYFFMHSAGVLDFDLL